MRRRLFQILGALSVMVFVGLLAPLSSSGPGNPTPSDRLPPPRPQTLTARQSQPVQVALWRIFGDRPETLLYNVDYIRAGPEVTVYVFDRGRQQILRLDPETGRITQTYGRGAGEEPGAFQMVTDFKVDEQGRVFVCDAVNARITLFDTNGRLMASLTPKLRPYRIALLSRDLLVVQLLHARSDALFEVYRLERKSDGSYRLRLLRRFGEFLEHQAANSLLLDGRITGADSFFVYAPRRIGWLTAFYPDGRLKFHRQTIEPVPMPRLIRRGATEYVDRSAPTVTYELTVDGDRLYTWTEGKDGQPYIDVYDAHTGDYQFSMPVPDSIKGLIDVKDTLIYAAYDTTVTIWRWHR